MSSEVTTGYGNLQGYELYDLVALSDQEYAVVIHVGSEKLKVIDNRSMMMMMMMIVVMMMRMMRMMMRMMRMMMMMMMMVVVVEVMMMIMMITITMRMIMLIMISVYDYIDHIDVNDYNDTNIFLYLDCCSDLLPSELKGKKNSLRSVT
jgi:hypothetical protein